MSSAAAARPPQVLEAYHLTPAGIADKVRQALTLKQALTL